MLHPQYVDVDIKSRDSNPDNVNASGDHGIGDRKVALTNSPAKVRTYWTRWFVLAVFSFNICVNTWTWIMAAPIADVFRCYYDVSNFSVNALSLCYCVVYVLFAIPSAFFLERYGLRVIMIFAISMGALGTSLRVIGTGANYFIFLLVGGAITSFNNLVSWGAGSFLSEVWFPVTERGTATAVAMAVAPGIGIMIGIGVTPLVIHQPNTVEICGNETYTPSPSPSDYADWSHAVYNQLFYYIVTQAALSIVLLLVIILGFPKAPPTPPSLSRKLEDSIEHSRLSMTQHLKMSIVSTLQTFKSVHFVIFAMVAGTMIAMIITFVSVINEIIIPFFPGYDEEISYLGFAAQGSALITMFIVGRILDLTKAFYILSVSMCWASAASVALLTFFMIYLNQFNLLYLGVILVGISMSGFQAVSYEYAVEMTYPLPEATSATLLNLVSQFISVAVVFIVGYLSQVYPTSVWWILVSLTGLAALLSVCVRPELRRLKIDQASKDQPIEKDKLNGTQ